MQQLGEGEAEDHSSEQAMCIGPNLNSVLI